MCNCLNKVLENITPKLQPKNEVKDLKVDWADRVFRLDGGIGVGLYVECSYYKIKHNGDAFANKTKDRHFVAMSFCPFCGEKLEKGKPVFEDKK